MLKEILLGLKKQLSFHLNAEEEQLVSKMTEQDFQNLRMLMLERIKSGELPLDVLEEYLEQEKENEKMACFNELGIYDIEKMSRLDAELDTKCSQVLIAIIKAIENKNEDVLFDFHKEELEFSRAK